MRIFVSGAGRVRPVANIWLAGIAVVCLGVSAPDARAQTFLTNAELLELLPGSTIYSKTDFGRPWAQIYSAPDGKIKGTIRNVFGKQRKYAKWFVRDGQWCENWVSAKPAGMWKGSVSNRCGCIPWTGSRGGIYGRCSVKTSRGNGAS